MANWEHYFHFPAGTDFDINGPFGYDGAGRVLEKTADLLKIRIDLDSWGPAPAFHAVIAVQYHQEGTGNTVILEPDGTAPSRDDQAVIRSNDGRRERAITSRDFACSIRYNGANEIDFDVHVNGQSWDFDLERV